MLPVCPSVLDGRVPSGGDELSEIARRSLFRRIVRRSFQARCDLHDVPMSAASHQPYPLARAQALDTWAAGRERAIAKLASEADALEKCDLAEEAVSLRHAVSRLQESARRERAEAAALRVASDVCTE